MQDHTGLYRELNGLLDRLIKTGDTHTNTHTDRQNLWNLEVLTHLKRGGAPHINLENKLEVARFLTSLRIQDRAECGKGTKLHWGGDTKKKKLILGRVHRTYFLDGGNYWDGEITYTGRGAPNIICCWGGGLLGRVHHVTMEEKQSGWVGWSMIL